MHALLEAIAAAPAGGTGPFNIAGITTVLGAVVGLALTVVGGASVFRAVSQHAHRHVMTSAAGALAGLTIAGISFAGLTAPLATQLATLIVHK